MQIQLRQIPFLKVVIYWIIGIVIYDLISEYLIDTYTIDITLYISLAALILLFALRHLELIWSILFLILNVSIAFLYTYWQHGIPEQDVRQKIYSKKPYSFTGHIVSEPILRFNTWQFELQCTHPFRVDSRNVLCKIPHDFYITYQLGDTLFCHAPLKAIPKPMNPFTFDAHSFYRYKGVNAQVILADSSSFTIKRGNIPNLISLRKKLDQKLSTWIRDTSTAAVAKALLLGIKNELPNELKHAYAKAGVMHVLALSGMHIGILLLFVNWILGRILPSSFFRSKVGISLFIIWWYVFLTGSSASVIRSATMFTILYMAPVFNKRYHAINSLALSACIMLLLDPYYIFQIGFQLSYLAVLGILLLYKPLLKICSFSNAFLQFIWKGICVSLAAQLFTLPICLFYFHQFATYFWLASILISITATCFMIIGFVALLLSGFPILDPIFSFILPKILFVQNELVYILNDIPGAFIESIWLNHTLFILLIILIIMISNTIIKKQMKWLHLTLLFSILLLSIWIFQDGMERSKKRISFFHHYKGLHIVYSVNRSSVSFFSTPTLKSVHNKEDRYLSSLRINERLHVHIPKNIDEHPLHKYIQTMDQHLIQFIPTILQKSKNHLIRCHWLIVTDLKFLSNEQLDTINSAKMIIYDGQLTPKSEEILLNWAAQHEISVVDISRNGFYEILI